MEDEEDRLLLVQLLLVFDVLLVLFKKLWVELDVSRLVDTVNITKASCNGEVRRDLLEGRVDSVNILRLSV